MRVVIQRVTEAKVCVSEKVVGEIQKGLLCLVGIARDDTVEDLEFISRKILNTKFWPDDAGKPWKNSVISSSSQVLAVSQFTLHGFLNGNKIDFHRAMGPGPAKDLFDALVEKLKTEHDADKIQQGAFGEYMQVSMVNDGPVTISIDSKNRKA